MSYFSFVRRCNYCGADFTEWHECAGTVRAKHRYYPEDQSKDQEFLNKLEALIAKEGKP